MLVKNEELAEKKMAEDEASLKKRELDLMEKKVGQEWKKLHHWAGHVRNTAEKAAAVHWKPIVDLTLNILKAD